MLYPTHICQSSLTIWLLLWSVIATAQYSTVSGYLLDKLSGVPVQNASIVLQGSGYSKTSASDGYFLLEPELLGAQVLEIRAPGYLPKKFPILLDGNPVALGKLFLELDITLDKMDNLISLTATEIAVDTETLSSATGLLQATRDVFLAKAAFDFGQAFFRVRGYDSREGVVYLNGIAMNKLLTGRPQWSNWGGLNDVVRNQEFTNGLEALDYGFGGILGNTNINLRPSGLRPGTRLSTAFSNRSYLTRIMATHSSGVLDNGFSYSVAASKRWGKEGYLNGTLYDAYSIFTAVEYQVDPKNALTFTGLLAKNRRGSSAPITEEVFELAGRRYNPYWGIQNGKIRNSRERLRFEPLLMLNHYYSSNTLRVTTGIAYQFGHSQRSRLGYFNAPNPDPTYYRYLPSFYINNPFGADFTNAALARDGFLENPQINWTQLYTANTNLQALGKASYLLYDDTISSARLSLSTAFNLKISPTLTLDFGGHFSTLDTTNYAEIRDLLGATFHEDVDPFSATRNDINGALNKAEGDKFGYNYEMFISDWKAFVQLQYNSKKWSGFLASSLQGAQYERNRGFQNERFLEEVDAATNTLAFSGFGLKGGLRYQIDGRHWIAFNGITQRRPPLPQNTFINPRENSLVIPNLDSEVITSVDGSYMVRLPQLTGRLTGFYTRFQNISDINFFFVDAGVGSDFVQEVITGQDQLHKGIELGIKLQASPSVNVFAVANLAEYTYASLPGVAINFDTAGAAEGLINPEGSLDLGKADLKDLRLGQGPQTAIAVGVEYRDPKYWWVATTASYLADNYAQISTIPRTPSFALSPETGLPFPQATPENISSLLDQQPLDNFYLLNIVGGKSWRIDGKYVSVFASINNVFDAVFRTGGFEQSRNGNYEQYRQDSLRDNPSFAPKFWYGSGRTFFVNLAIAF